MRTIFDGDAELRRPNENDEDADWQGDYSNLDHYLVEGVAGDLQDREEREMDAEEQEE